MLGLSPSTASASIPRRKRNLPLETFGEVKAIFNLSMERSSWIMPTLDVP